jgi:two-component system chemotaxis sensor kinase CheA
MLSAVAISKLEQTISKLPAAGCEGLSAVQRDLLALAAESSAGELAGLAAHCAEAARQVHLLAEDPAGFALRAGAVVSQLEALLAYASACAAVASQGGGELPAPPAPFVLPADDEAAHYRESVAMFLAQAGGNLADLEEELLAIEQAADPRESVASVRRVMHTMKAEFGVLNMLGAQRLCHGAESAIDAWADSGRPFPVDVMLECADQLKQQVERLTKDVAAPFPEPTALLARLAAWSGEAAPEPADTAPDEPVQLAVGGEFADSLAEFVLEARSHLADAEAAMVGLDGEVLELEAINLTFRAFHTIKGVAGFLNLTPLVDLAHVAETLLDALRNQRIEFRRGHVDLILQAGDRIQQMIGSLEGQVAPGRRQVAQLQQWLEAAARGELAGAIGMARRPARDGRREAPATAVLVPQPAVPPPAVAGRPVANAEVGVARPAKVERTVKVSTSRLDMLVDMVGELVIAQSMVLQDPALQRIDSQTLTRNLGQVGKITRDLQEAAMSLRMVTVKATFQKMARLVRDVAAKAGKKVCFSVHGEDTELDRNVVEQISDPLVHMIRNAIDHGIEPPEGRAKVGKEVEGNLSLRAFHQGGAIVIEIQDDGRGIDARRVAQKAVDKGLITAETAAGISEAEAFQLIFLPGFSTAETVTDLSGRGVGMDVVRRNIEALRGKIEIDSQLGVGTRFRLRLPLTLAIIDGMIVRVGSERYVVPTLSIETSFRPSAAAIHAIVDRGECVQVRGSVLPIYRLNRVFAQRDGLEDLTQGILIITEVDGERCCLFVDEILGQQQVVIKSLGAHGGNLSGVSGGAIMSDGRVALILDIGSLVQSALHI